MQYSCDIPDLGPNFARVEGLDRSKISSKAKFTRNCLIFQTYIHKLSRALVCTVHKVSQSCNFAMQTSQENYSLFLRIKDSGIFEGGRQ